MIEKIWKFCVEKNLIQENDFIVAGISGGADSVCLLFVLLELKKRIPFDINVVHVNHGIREEAGEDAEYVKQLCREYNIPFTLVECKVEEYAKEKHLSCEEAGREIRYKAFYELLQTNDKGSHGKIAIAHNENDLAETFMFNLFRGSGLKGLVGIQSKRDEIIRPLLCVSRKEIEAYLNERNIKYVIDRTNLEDDYTRNRIRHHILPAAEKEVTNAIEHINEAANKIEEAYELINEITIEKYDECVIKKENSLVIIKDKFDKLHQTLKGYVAKMAIEKTAGKSKDISTVHVMDLCDLMEKQVGRSICLPYDVVAKRVYDGIELKTGYDNTELKEDVINDRIVMTKREISKDDMKNIPTNTYTKWFDYDKIKGSVVLRHRKPGDYFVLDAQGHRKTLKSFFIDKKVPEAERNEKLLLADGDHIMWIVGERISFDYRISEETKNILIVELIHG